MGHIIGEDSGVNWESKAQKGDDQHALAADNWVGKIFKFSGV